MFQHLLIPQIESLHEKSVSLFHRNEILWCKLFQPKLQQQKVNEFKQKRVAIESRLFEFPIGIDSKAVVLGKFRRILQFVESNEVVSQRVEVNELKIYWKLFKSFWRFIENIFEMFLI